MIILEHVQYYHKDVKMDYLPMRTIINVFKQVNVMGLVILLPENVNLHVIAIQMLNILEILPPKCVY